ncbi:hypothetical protein [Bacteroides intestinalis]|jgi:hypothetical protein|uniref:hypothetical protein n=1 Tax=Bacteroides intestinalis TaxID=329854 RepID=UPI0018A0FBC2|nr:hypothetical protein [Bacteroides intestinalis]
METRSFTTNSRLLNILLLCVGIFTVTSCETDEAVEQAITSNSLMTRGISISSIPTDFFYCSNDRLSPIIETLQEVESENHFTEHFQEEYGIPLWDYTYNIEEEIYFVPLFNDKTPMEINAIWFFHVVDGRMTYVPFKRDNDFIVDNEQRFLFDLLSYIVFGENNSSGYIFKEQTPQTRAWVTVTTCWKVYTGVGDEANLKYRYTDCIDKLFWIDNSTLNTPELGTGDNIIIGGSGGSSSSASNNTSAIFKNEKFSKNTWEILDNILNEILEDCMGSSLYGSIKSLLKGDKIEILIVDGLDSSYNWDTKTLSLDINCLESNAFLHELMHLYQTLQESTSSFEGAMLNREIEAHYAQYIFLIKQPLWEEKYKDIYSRNPRGKAVEALDNYFDKHGHLKDESVSDVIETVFSEQIIPSFRKEEPYNNYPYDKRQSISRLFPNIEVLTKNCN